MKNKILIICVIGFLLLTYLNIVPAKELRTPNFGSCGDTTEVTVDDDGPADFSKIQDAIDNANEGDKIVVRSGVYYEHLEINKPLTLLGSNKENTIISAVGDYQSGISILASNVNVFKFTIQDAHVGFPRAIQVGKNSYGTCKNICISDCILKECPVGIGFIMVENGFINNCEIYSCPGQSIYLGSSCKSIKIDECSIHDCGKVDGDWISSGGIFIQDGSNSIYDMEDIEIANCEMYNIVGYSINVFDINNSKKISVRDIYIHDNLIYNTNDQGVGTIYVIGDPTNVEIRENTLTNNLIGISLFNSDGVNTKVIGNKISKCQIGIDIYFSPNVIIKENEVFKNKIGLRLYAGHKYDKNKIKNENDFYDNENNIGEKVRSRSTNLFKDKLFFLKNTEFVKNILNNLMESFKNSFLQKWACPNSNRGPWLPKPRG